MQMNPDTNLTLNFPTLFRRLRNRPIGTYTEVRILTDFKVTSRFVSPFWIGELRAIRHCVSPLTVICSVIGCNSDTWCTKYCRSCPVHTRCLWLHHSQTTWRGEALTSHTRLLSWLVFWKVSATQDYIRAEKQILVHLPVILPTSDKITRHTKQLRKKNLVALLFAAWRVERVCGGP